jgi:hypothetical protein
MAHNSSLERNSPAGRNRWAAVRNSVGEPIETSWFTRFPLPLCRSTASRHTEACGSFDREGKPVSAIRRWLIVPPINRQPRDAAVEQGSRAAVANDGDIVVRRGLRCLRICNAPLLPKDNLSSRACALSRVR